MFYFSQYGTGLLSVIPFCVSWQSVVFTTSANFLWLGEEEKHFLNVRCSTQLSICGTDTSLMICGLKRFLSVTIIKMVFIM